VPVKVALPKGRLLRRTAALLQKAEWGLDEYQSSMGFYRPKAQKFPDMIIRIFHEKDIPIQIAMGNYDLGICGLDWLEELLVKYPGSSITKVKDLLYGTGSLYMAAASFPLNFKRNGTTLRIASEYPNLA
jgi:ATP phosphoribosyltransferase